MEAKDSGLENPLSSIGECTCTRTERGTRTATTPVNRNEDGLHNLLHAALAIVVPTAEVRHDGGQTRSDDMRTDCGGDLGTVEQTALGTGSRMPLMLGHHRGDFGQLGDLVPLRFGIVGRGLIGQGTVTTQAGGGHVADDVVDALGRESLAVMTGVSRLPAGLSSGGAFDHGLGRTKGIGGGRGRGVGGVAGQLSAEVADFGFQFGNPLQRSLQESTQMDALRTRCPRRRSDITHGLRR
jgi:hypothetical protein